MITTYSNIENYKKIGGIYYIINLITNKKYIGSTKDFYKRYKDHSNKSSSFSLRKDFIIYGKENFFFKIIDIIDNVSSDNLEKIEQEHLDMYYAQEYIISNRKDKRFIELLYNNRARSSKRTYHICKEETKKLWSEQRVGKNNPRWGISLDINLKKKISETVKNKYKNGYLNPNQGKVTKESSKKKMVDAFNKSGKTKTVYCLSLDDLSIQSFTGFKSAHRKTNVDPADIRRICNKVQLYSKEYYFSFEEITELNKTNIIQEINSVKKTRKQKLMDAKNKPTKRWKKIKLLDVVTKEEQVFDTMKKCCKFLQTNRTTLLKYIENDFLYKNIYKLNYFDNENKNI